MQVQQTVLATMSLGPVGLADQLTSYPSNASADITSNKTLVMATCTTNGTLLQPSYPLTPIDSMMIGAGDFGDCFTPERHVAYTYGCGGHIWATYTAVDMPAPTLPPLRQPAPPFAATATAAAASSAAPSAAASGVWYTAIGWVAGRTKPKAAAIDLYESDLASMVDGGAADGAAATSYGRSILCYLEEHCCWYFAHPIREGRSTPPSRSSLSLSLSVVALSFMKRMLTRVRNSNDSYSYDNKGHRFQPSQCKAFRVPVPVSQPEQNTWCGQQISWCRRIAAQSP